MDTHNVFVALFIAFLWGIQPVVHKHLLGKYKYITIMLISVIVYFFLVVSLALTMSKDIKNDIRRMPIRDLLILAILSLFTIFIANMLYYYVLKNHSSSIVASLIYAAPAFTLIFAYIFLKERLTTYGVLGVIVMVIGIILIMVNESYEKEFEYT